MVWVLKANLRGAPGYNATGAAEDDAAIAAFVLAGSGATDTSDAVQVAAGAANVKLRGAGVGLSNDSPIIQAAMDAFDHIIIPSGTYNIGTPLVVSDHNQIIEFTPGAIFKATASMSDPMLRSSGFDGTTILGNGAIFDLNQLADNGILIEGTNVQQVFRGLIRDITVTNKTTTADPSAAIMFRWTTDSVGENLRVTNYGPSNPPGGVGYAVASMFCVSHKLSKLTLSNVDVGIEIQQCTEIQVVQFTIKTARDNGVYILAGSTAVKLSQGWVDTAEEGIVVRSSDVTIDGVKITNCTNKGITLRLGTNTKIVNCHFQGNATHIGDSVSGPDTVEHCIISGNTFRDATALAVDLTAVSDVDMSFNDFSESVYAGSYIVRMSNKPRNRFIGNRCDNPAKTATTFLRLSGSGAVNCEVSNNTFVEAGTAVNLFDSSGSPSNTLMIHNRYLNVTTKLTSSGGVTGTVEVKLPIIVAATLDFPSIAATGGSQVLTTTATGAVTSDSVVVTPPPALNAGLQATAWVSATDTVSVRVTNSTAGALDPASGVFRLRVQ